MLGSNWKALIASNAVQVSKKRKAVGSEAGSSGSASASASASAHAAAAAPAAVTPCLAIDCEFVGVGLDGVENALARVSIVNFHGEVVVDKFVRPAEKVTDYRTAVSGVRAANVHSKQACTFKQVQREVAELIEGKILVGHALQNDLSVLLLSHPKHLIRDTSRYKGLCPDRPRALKKLVAEFLKQDIQRGEHNSVEDARATLLLYKHMRVRWEKELFDKQHKRTSQAAAAAAASSSSAASSDRATDVESSSSASFAVSAASHKKAAADPSAAKFEARKARNVDRNQRRKKMRTEQKVEKQNR